MKTLFASSKGIGIGVSKLFSFLAFTFGLTTFTFAQFLPECTSEVPLLTIDLSASPDSTYITPVITREGICCTPANSSARFISFLATLHPNAAMVEIGIADGANPPGSGEYHFVDGGDLIIPGTCIPPTPAGAPVCIPPILTGPTYKIMYGKPGNNPNTFFFRQILKPTFPQDDTTRVGCSLPINIYGLENIEINSINSSTGNTTLGAYNSLLSCTNCSNPSFSPGLATPEWIDYRICGTQEASTACGIYETCDTVRLYTRDMLEAFVTPNPAEFCVGGNVLLSASAIGGDGNYSYYWFNSDGDTISNINTYDATTAGVITAEISDGLISPTCPAEYVSVPVTQGLIPVTDAGMDQTVCATSPQTFLAGSVTNATGGTWSGGLGTYDPSPDSLLIVYTPTAAEINAGFVTLTLTSSGAGGGCINSSDDVTIFFSDTVYVNPSYSPLVCNGDIATVAANATGGTAPYSYAWSTGQTNSSINVPSGTYSVTVQDVYGCTGNSPITVMEPPVLVLTTTSTNTSTDLACDGSAEVVVVGGVGPYTYDWDYDGTGDFDDPSNPTGFLCYGAYQVTIEDALGCQSTISVVVNNQTCSLFDVTATNTNVECYGDATAQAFSFPTGGTAPYTYSWNTAPVQTTQNATGLSAGTYTVTVTDDFGCIDMASVNVIQPSVITNTMTHTDVTSIGGNNGSATANPLGGTPGYTYLWNPTGQTTQTANTLTAGVYYVNIEDGNSCLKVDSVQINQPPCNDFMLAVNTKNITCNGLTNGSAYIVIAQGTPPYSISWSSGEIDVMSVNGLSAGSYSVSVTDASNCTTFETFDITEPTPLTMGLVATNISCHGAADGTIDLTVTGGTFPYQFEWFQGGITIAKHEDLVNLGPGTYSVVVTDANGCTTSGSIGITQPTQLAATYSYTDIVCFGDGNGTIDATVTGGVMPYGYDWTGPGGYTASTQDISGLEQGLYEMNVVDGNGCELNNLMQVYIYEPDSVKLVSYVLPCPAPGANDVALTVDSLYGGIGEPYAISFDNGVSYNALGDYDQVLPLGATYNLIVRDTNGCLSPDTTTVTIDAKVEIADVTFDPCVSPGTTDINITVTPNGGDGGPYEVSTDGGTSWNPAGTYVILLPVGANYNVVIRDGKGCESVAWPITIPAPFDASAVLTAEVTCLGGSDGSVNLTVTGGTSPYTFAWTGPGAYTSTSEDISGLMAGTYDVTVTDDSACIATTSIVVTTIPDVTDPVISCAVGNQFETSDGGVCYYTHTGPSWDATASDNCAVSTIEYTLSGATIGTGTTLDGVQFNLGLTTVTWVATDVLGNTDTCTFNVTVTDDELPAISSCGAAGTQNVVADGGVCYYTQTGTGWDATATDNCTVSTIEYSLSGATTGTGTTLDGVQFNLGTTTVTWTVTDGSGNESTCSFTVEVADDQLPAISSCGAAGTQNVIADPGVCKYTHSGTGWNATATDNCSVSTIIYTLSGVTTGSGTSLNGVSFNLGTTTVTWTVTDGSGNISTCTFDVVVTDTELPAISTCGPSGNPVVNANLGTCTYTYSGTGWNAQATDNCSVSSIVYTLSGATTGSGTSLNGVSFNLGVTNVLWTVTDGSGNTSTCSYTVTVLDDQYPSILSCGAVGTQNVSTDLGVCTYTQNGTGWDATAADNCSIASITYVLTGATAGSGSSLNGVVFAQGTTTVTWTATDGSGNSTTCTFNVVVTDNEVPAIAGCLSDINVNNDNGDCGAIVTWLPPTYTDNCGATMTSTHNSGDYFPVGTTTVTYTVVDGTGNTSICSFNVIVTDSELPQLTCNGNIAQCDSLITFSAPTATDNCGVVSITQTSGLPSGSIYPVGTTTVTFEALDVNGNTNTCSFDVTVHPTPVLSTVDSDISCFNAGDGAIDLTVTSGTAPFTYTWSNAATTQDISNLAPGVYYVSVVDVFGCSANTSDTITQPNMLTLSKVVTDVSCHGGSDGAIDLTIDGGTTPYAFDWNNGATTEDVANLIIGNYTVTVTDDHGCQVFNATDIVQPDSITIQTVTTDATCNAANGSINALVTGGITPYTYLWSNGATTLNLTNAVGGTYTLIVTDVNGCQAIATDSIRSTTNISGHIHVTDAFCNGGETGTVLVVIESGNGPFTYAWSTGDTLNGVENLPAGVYTVDVTDAFGCSMTLSEEIFEPEAITIDLYSPEPLAGYNISLFGGSDGSIQSTVGGGTTPYTYLWSNGSTSPNINGLTAGNYSVLVTDENGCTATDNITLIAPRALAMPEGLSPNGDGDNDYFVIRGIEAYPNNELIVYNRWGNVVYTQSGYQNDWQGVNSKGEELPDGTYFAIFKPIVGGAVEPLTGYIDLRRSR